jgi:GT2 family glycosyltransferase
LTIRPTRVTVIIATYNRAALLDECLDHLSRQRFSPGDEVIVVDNGSTDHTAAVVARQQRGYAAPLRLVHESAPGKSVAIARALAVATGDVLAFTDDDVNVDEGWLDAVRDAMTDPAVALVGGPVKPRWQSTVPGWIRRGRDRHPRLGSPIALLDYGDRAVELGPRTLLGANLAVRRDVFIKVGGFPATLGKLRGTLLSGEDHELCRRVQDAGFCALYVPQVAVEHWGAGRSRPRLLFFEVVLLVGNHPRHHGRSEVDGDIRWPHARRRAALPRRAGRNRLNARACRARRRQPHIGAQPRD